MLPGFRFLFAAIVLSMSVLVFGLGAAAVLRAAHEQFAESGTWRPAPDTSAAQQSDVTRPTLAMLRVEPRATAPKAADPVPAPALAQPAEATSPPDVEKTTALDPQSPAPPKAAQADTPEAAKAEIAKVDVAKPDVAPELQNVGGNDTQIVVIAAPSTPPEPAHAPTAQPAALVDAPAATETKTAAADPISPAASTPAATAAPITAPAISPSPAADEPAVASNGEALPTQPEQLSTPAAADPATARIATLGGPPVAIEEPVARGDLDQSDAKKKERAEERARRRRLAARQAKLARQAAQAANPFTSQTLQFIQPSFANATARAR